MAGLDLGALLRRIGLEDTPDELVAKYRDNLAGLIRLLHLQFVLAFPFENADVFLFGEAYPKTSGSDSEPATFEGVRLDIASLYQKLVVRGRGGVCYEKNLLLAYLLMKLLGLHAASLGEEAADLEVDLVSICVFGRRVLGSFWLEPASHCSPTVGLRGRHGTGDDSLWFPDVGFGDSSSVPLIWPPDHRFLPYDVPRMLEDLVDSMEDLFSEECDRKYGHGYDAKGMASAVSAHGAADGAASFFYDQEDELEGYWYRLVFDGELFYLFRKSAGFANFDGAVRQPGTWEPRLRWRRTDAVGAQALRAYFDAAEKAVGEGASAIECSVPFPDEMCVRGAASVNEGGLFRDVYMCYQKTKAANKRVTMHTFTETPYPICAQLASGAGQPSPEAMGEVRARIDVADEWLHAHSEQVSDALPPEVLRAVFSKVGLAAGDAPEE